MNEGGLRLGRATDWGRWSRCEEIQWQPGSVCSLWPRVMDMWISFPGEAKGGTGGCSGEAVCYICVRRLTVQASVQCHSYSVRMEEGLHLSCVCGRREREERERERVLTWGSEALEEASLAASGCLSVSVDFTFICWPFSRGYSGDHFDITCHSCWWLSILIDDYVLCYYSIIHSLT